MILDDENILMSDLQESVDNPFNSIKVIRDNYGTFNCTEVTNVLFNIFNNIPDNKDTHFLKKFLAEFGWFIDIMDEYRIIITDHPKRHKGSPGHLFEIRNIKTDNGLSYSIHFYEYTCTLGGLIKSYMVNKYKLIQVESGGWVPEYFKHEWGH